MRNRFRQHNVLFVDAPEYDNIVEYVVDGSQATLGLSVVGATEIKVTDSSGGVTTNTGPNGAWNPFTTPSATAGTIKVETNGTIKQQTFGAGLAGVLEVHVLKATTFTQLDAFCNALVNMTIFTTVAIPALTRMSQTFLNCSSLLALELDLLDTSNSTIFQQTFSGCSALVCISELDTTAWTDNTNNMFLNCTAMVNPTGAEQTALTDAGGATYVKTGGCIEYDYDAVLNTNGTAGTITFTTNSDGMEVKDSDNNITTLLSGSRVTAVAFGAGVTSITVRSLSGGTVSECRWIDLTDIIETIVIASADSLTTLSNLVLSNGGDNVTSIEVNSTSAVAFTNSMFNGLPALAEIILNVPNRVSTDMSHAFRTLPALVSLDLSNFGNLGTVTGWDDTFNGDSALKCISNLDTTGGTSTFKYRMFNLCNVLTSPSSSAQTTLKSAGGTTHVSINPCPPDAYAQLVANQGAQHHWIFGTAGNPDDTDTIAGTLLGSGSTKILQSPTFLADDSLGGVHDAGKCDLVLPNDGTHGFSVSLLVRLQATNGYRTVLTSTVQNALFLGIANGRTTFYYAGSNHPGTVVINTNQIYHLAYTVASNGDWKTYVDGVEDATGTAISITTIDLEYFFANKLGGEVLDADVARVTYTKSVMSPADILAQANLRRI